MSEQAPFIHITDNDDCFDDTLGWKGEPAPAVPDYSQIETESDAPSGMTRRGFVTMLTAATLAPSVLDSDAPPEIEPSPEVEIEPVLEEIETIEQLHPSERFMAEISGFEEAVQLRHDEVLFVDEFNVPVGPPIKFENFDDTHPDHEGLYKYSAGTVDRYGILTEEAPRLEWRRYVVEKFCPAGTEAEQGYNVVQDFQAALREDDEPELVAAIQAGEIETCDDLISHFADKPVRGAEHVSRREYAQEMVMFRSEDEGGRPAVPPGVQAELRRLLPGLFANESKFHCAWMTSWKWWGN